MPLENDGTYVVSTPEELKALSDPIRRTLLQELSGEPKTTKQVAQSLGIASTKLYHHVALLEAAGLLTLVETRQKRGTTERYLRCLAKRIEIRTNPTLLDGNEAVNFVAEAFEAAARKIRRQANFASESERKVLAMQGKMRMEPEQAVEFSRKVEALMQEFSSESAGAEDFEIVVAVSRIEGE